MEVIQSFTIDHTKLKPGIYISREDKGFTTYDLRITTPNKEPAVPPKEEIVPKRLDEAKTKEVLEKAKDFVSQIFGMSHEEAEELGRKMSEEIGVKMGDFMMPIRMAVTGSRVSPPLIGSILILGKDEAIARIDRTLAAF